jgi:arsenate reductase-like glutaredoxin family protein
MELAPLAAAETLIVEDTTRARKAKAKEETKAIVDDGTLPQQSEGYADSLSPDQMLKPMFVSTPSVKELLKHSSRVNGTKYKWAGQSLVPSVSAAGCVAFTNPLAVTSPFLAIAAVAGVSALAFAGSFRTVGVMNKKTTDAHRRLEKIAEPGFLQWLKSRYGIVISSKTSQQLALLYTFNGSISEIYSQKCRFKDSATGKSYTLCRYFTYDEVSRTFYLRVEEPRYGAEALTLQKQKGIEEEKLLKAVQAKANQFDALTPKKKRKKRSSDSNVEAETSSPTLAQKILTDLARLNEHPLTIEEKHIVGRIRETLNDGLTTYERIIAFGPNPEAEQEMATLLQTLDAETTTLVKEQLDSLVKSLTQKTIFSKDVAKATISGTGALDMTQNAS